MSYSGPQLDQALLDWIGNARPDWTIGRRVSMAQRLGWSGLNTPTLEEVGRSLGISRQSAHAAQRGLEDALRRSPDAPLEAIAEALRHASAKTPIREDRLQREFPNVTVAGLLHAADLAGLGHSLHLDSPYVLEAQQDPPPVERAIRTALDTYRKVGVCSIHAVASSVGAAVQWSEQDLAVDLANGGLPDEVGWPWVTALKDGDNPLLDVIARMLVVADAIDLDDIERACDRRHRSGRMPFVPPHRVLVHFVERHPGLTLTDGLVAASAELPSSPRRLNASERLIVATVENSQRGFSTRAELAAAANANDLGEPALAYALSYSPIVRRLGRSQWGLVGNRNADKGTRAKTRPIQVAFEWSKGAIALSATIGEGTFDVLPIPGSASRYLRSGTYTPAAGNASTQDLEVTRHKVSGLGPYLAAQPAGSRDRQLTIRLDSVRRTWSGQISEVGTTSQ